MKVGTEVRRMARGKGQLAGRALGAPWALCVLCAKLLGGPPWSLHCCLGQGEEWALCLSEEQRVTPKKDA